MTHSKQLSETMLRIQLEEEERSFIRMTQNQSIFLIATKVATLQLIKLNKEVLN